jgi:hypothetical protein
MIDRRLKRISKLRRRLLRHGAKVAGAPEQEQEASGLESGRSSGGFAR